MKTIRNRMILLLALSIGTIVGIFRGSEAKQKWVFRIKSRFDEKRQIAEQKKLIRDGGVALDDIELAAFHNNWFTINFSQQFEAFAGWWRLFYAPTS